MTSDQDGGESAQREKEKRMRQDLDKGAGGTKSDPSNQKTGNQQSGNQQSGNQSFRQPVPPAKPPDGKQSERKPQPGQPGSKEDKGGADRDNPGKGVPTRQPEDVNPQPRRPGEPYGAGRPVKGDKASEGKKGTQRADEDGDEEPS